MQSSVFQLIDFDRTLFDTAAFSKAITEEVNRVEPGFGTILAERVEAAYTKEETFFMLRYLRQEKGDEWFEQLVDRVLEDNTAASFLLPGVAERLAFAETLGLGKQGWGILTYGDAIDQHMKLRIAGLEDAPVYIAHTPDKGSVLTDWQQPDGRFKLPDAFGGLVVDALTFEDDKFRAFGGLPDGVLGLWVTHDSAADQRIQEAAFVNVFAVSSLHESIERIREYILKG